MRQLCVVIPMGFDVSFLDPVGVILKSVMVERYQTISLDEYPSGVESWLVFKARFNV